MDWIIFIGKIALMIGAITFIGKLLERKFNE